MALEAVVFPQDLFGCNTRELCNKGEEVWGYDFGGEAEEEKGVLLECDLSGGAAGQVGRGLEQGRGVGDGMHGTWDTSCSSMSLAHDWDVNSSSPEFGADDTFAVSPGPAAGRRKRRRSKSFKNQVEVENQRMTHIAVERNRRKQMNEYLSVLRSLMPASYAQRGDQASIVGGAINFVKELEKLVHSLEAHKRINQRSSSAPFADFFTFPQHSSSSSRCLKSATNDSTSEAAAENQSAAADIEVTMVESHANLKVLSRRRPKQLLKMVVGLQNLHLTTLHLNITTIDEIVLYSFNLKVEDECQLTSVDEIATAVHQIIRKIQGPVFWLLKWFEFQVLAMIHQELGEDHMKVVNYELVSTQSKKSPLFIK